MRDRLEGKSYVEQYVHGLTHELRSPLSGIHGSAELLAGDIPPDDRKRFVEHIHRETTRMQTLVDRLLELATLEQRHDLQGAEPLKLSSLVETVRAALAPQMERHSITLQVDVPVTATVRGEAFLLEQALRNLWQNALDHSPNGGNIRVTAVLLDGRWQVAVHNAGDPIPDFALPRLFERFYSLPRSSSRAKGYGLGLPLAQSIAALHGGVITVSNDPAGGVVASLVIPAAGRHQWSSTHSP
jgi:two-component system sensor histidine kinase CreC